MHMEYFELLGNHVIMGWVGLEREGFWEDLALSIFHAPMLQEWVLAKGTVIMG